MAMIFDTLKLSKSLRDAEFSETQADALAAALSEQAQTTLATKADLLQLEMKIVELKTELKAEISDNQAAMISEFAKVRGEISLMRADTIKWIVSAIAFNFVAMAGFFKLFAK